MRHWLNVVLGEILLGQLGEGQLSGDALGSSCPFELQLERVTGVGLGSEPAPLHPLRTAARDPVAIGPEGAAVALARFEPEHLALLNHWSLLRGCGMNRHGA